MYPSISDGDASPLYPLGGANGMCPNRRRRMSRNSSFHSLDTLAPIEGVRQMLEVQQALDPSSASSGSGSASGFPAVVWGKEGAEDYAVKNKKAGKEPRRNSVQRLAPPVVDAKAKRVLSTTTVQRRNQPKNNAAQSIAEAAAARMLSHKSLPPVKSKKAASAPGVFGLMYS